MNLLVWKIIMVIIAGASGSPAAFTIFSRVMGRGPVRFASRRYRHLLIIIALYGRGMFMSRRLIIFGNYLPHKSDVYVRDRQFPHSIPAARACRQIFAITYPRSFALHVPSRFFFCLVLPLYFAEIREDVKILSRVIIR